MIITEYGKLVRENDKMYTPIPKDGAVSRLTLMFSNGAMSSSVCQTGDLIQGNSVDEAYLKGCLENKRIVYVGTYSHGNADVSYLDYAEPLLKKSAKIGRPVDLFSRDYFPILEEMAAQNK